MNSCGACWLREPLDDPKAVLPACSGRKVALNRKSRGWSGGVGGEPGGRQLAIVDQGKGCMCCPGSPLSDSSSSQWCSLWVTESRGTKQTDPTWAWKIMVWARLRSFSVAPGLLYHICSEYLVPSQLSYMYSLRWGTIFEAGVYISWFWSPASRGNWKWKRTADSQTYFISHYQTHWNGSFDKLYLPCSLITSRKWLFSKVLCLDCPVWVLLTPACEMIPTRNMKKSSQQRAVRIKKLFPFH